MNQIKQCPKCQGYFKIEEQFANFPGCKEPEEISCPYNSCDYIYTRRSNGIFRTYKVDTPIHNK